MCFKQVRGKAACAGCLREGFNPFQHVYIIHTGGAPAIKPKESECNQEKGAGVGRGREEIKR